MPWTNIFGAKTVIVTGGGRGIGRAICVELHKLGAIVYAVSKNPDNLKSLQEECPSVRTVVVDLSDWDATREAMERIEAVDMLVNNAAIAAFGGLFQVTEHDFDSVCAVNLKAVINVSQVVAKKMIDGGKAGSIVNISSVAGLKAMPMACAYSTLKAGLDHLTKIMAIELGPKNIRVNSVNPGAVPTDMLASFQNEAEKNPVLKNEFEQIMARIVNPKKMIDPIEVVNSVLFLLSNSAPMITGTLLTVDGGFNIS